MSDDHDRSPDGTSNKLLDLELPATKPTAREIYKRLIATTPDRFREAKAGEAFGIAAARKPT